MNTGNPSEAECLAAIRTAIGEGMVAELATQGYSVDGSMFEQPLSLSELHRMIGAIPNLESFMRLFLGNLPPHRDINGRGVHLIAHADPAAILFFPTVSVLCAASAALEELHLHGVRMAIVANAYMRLLDRMS
jgi:hypothetical protein